MIGYAYLSIAVLSLGLLGVLHKVADYQRCRPAAVNLLLFFWAMVFVSGVCFIRQGLAATLSVPSWVCAVAAVCGTFASLAILNFQHGVRYGKISTSWLVINLSTAVPTILSIVFYKEQVSLRRGLGLTLAVLALILLWLDRQGEESGMLSSSYDHEKADSRASDRRC
jgi:drug/metabolite transporter (DMT)-like permease